MLTNIMYLTVTFSKRSTIIDAVIILYYFLTHITMIIQMLQVR